jgi:hypothetical protein
MTLASLDRAQRMMPWLLVLYAAAGLLHFAHNAEYLAQYPNLPAWLSRADVYWAWCAVTAAGLLGYALYRTRRYRAGLTVLGIYGVLGFGGLLHYARAPMGHHSTSMNLTIWTEVVAAAVFLINLAIIATQRLRPRARDLDR